jgi:hypothetical protein
MGLSNGRDDQVERRPSEHSVPCVFLFSSCAEAKQLQILSPQLFMKVETFGCSLFNAIINERHPVAHIRFNKGMAVDSLIGNKGIISHFNLTFPNKVCHSCQPQKQPFQYAFRVQINHQKGSEGCQNSEETLREPALGTLYQEVVETNLQKIFQRVNLMIERSTWEN